MEERKNINRRFDKSCPDCGKPITDYAKRCKSCASVVRMAKMYPRITIECIECGKTFDKKPSQARKAKFCSKKCMVSYRDNRPTIKCSHCDKLFKITKQRLANSKNPTCSWECRDQFRRENPPVGHHPKVKMTCCHCRKRFVRYQSTVVSKNVFCNIKCKVDWWKGSNHTLYNSIDCICEVCGTEFKRTKYKVEKSGGKYCSRECSSASQVIPGTDGYRGPNWKQQRRKARHRDKYSCQMCNIHESEYGCQLDVHHKIPFREFGTVAYKEANRLSNLVSLCKSCHMKVEKGNATI